MLPDEERCEATVHQRDDRWGGFVSRCQARRGHEDVEGTDHEIAFTACTPTAVLRWTGTYSPKVRADAAEPGDVLVRGTDIRWRVEVVVPETPRLGGPIVRLRCRTHRDEVETLTLPADQMVTIERATDRG